MILEKLIKNILDFIIVKSLLPCVLDNGLYLLIEFGLLLCFRLCKFLRLVSFLKFLFEFCDPSSLFSKSSVGLAVLLVSRFLSGLFVRLLVSFDF